VSRLPIKCGTLDVSQPYRPPRLVIRIASYFLASTVEATDNVIKYINKQINRYI
jgi:hypothetical protein